MFGCDTCQDVCPWNRLLGFQYRAEFTPIPELLEFSLQDWQELTEENFKKIFRHSPLKRAKFDGIRRNLRFIQH